MRVFRKGETGSTNDDARAGVPGDVFVAERQLAGRGRIGHRWLSNAGENLTFSAVLDAAGRPCAEVATLPLVVGLAVADALAKTLPDARFGMKWPNDVLSGDRKVAGILCERRGDAVIAGVGVNVNQTDFPAELESRATSLAILAGRPFDREAVLDAALRSLERRHGEWLAGGFASLYGDVSRIDLLRGRFVSVAQTDDDPAPLTGLCGGICEDGSLAVGDGRAAAGEAHVLSLGDAP